MPGTIYVAPGQHAFLRRPQPRSRKARRVPRGNCHLQYFSKHGYFGAIDFSKFQNGKYAEDYDDFTYQFNYDLGFGDEGPEVQLLQTALQVLGYFPKTHPLTVFFGKVTLEVVKKFQLAHG